MADAPALDAAFFSFRKRDRRFVLTRGAVGYLIGYLVLLAGYLALMWPTLSALLTWYFEAIAHLGEGNGAPPPALPENLLGGWPTLALSSLLSFVLFAAFEAACLRWLVRNESGGGLLGLTLGRDTWLVVAVYFAWLGLFIAFCVFVVALYALLRLLGQALPVLQLLWMLLAALAPLALIGLAIWGGVRLAPAAALSVAQSRFVFFRAWGATRAYFWQLLGAFLLLLAGYIVISMIIGSILQIPMNQAMMPIVTELMAGGEPAALAARFLEVMGSPLMLASLAANIVASVILSCVLYIAFFGVNACLAGAALEQGKPAG